jgi:NADH-quinone oxidoreductase subunit L
VIWVLAVATALMTAFYMFRLVYMTFYGEYRGPAWETAGHAAVATAAVHGAPHPADPHAHGQAHRADHEVTHGPAEPPLPGRPRRRPRSRAVARSARIAQADDLSADGARRRRGAGGFVGIPAALGGGNAIEHFLEPSFTASHVEARGDSRPASGTENPLVLSRRGDGAASRSRTRLARRRTRLMGFSVLIAVAGILLARRFYVTNPEISERMASQYAGAASSASNKYYVDELYNSTVISGRCRRAAACGRSIATSSTARSTARAG